MMENAEEIYHFLEDFSKRKPKVIPQELNDYLTYVARTGDPVYQWTLVKSLFKEKLMNVITDFYEITPGLEIPPYPNVDPFNYDTMKNSLLERLDSFSSAPFTVQRICELLTDPRKQYNRIDKFMRAIEKNILVVSTREPGVQRPAEPDNEVPEPVVPIVNGSDNSEYNVDVEMEDVSWKENSQQNHVKEPQPSSSDTHISVDDVETRLQAKQTETSKKSPDKSVTEYESLTPPELDEDEMKTQDDEIPPPATADVEPLKELAETESTIPEATDPLEQDTKTDATDSEMKTEEPKEKELVVIPEIKVDDAEMTEKRLSDEQIIMTDPVEKPNESPPQKEAVTEIKEIQPEVTDESSSDTNMKEDIPKIISEGSSSEESSMSSETTDGNSNSPNTENEARDIQEPITPPPAEVGDIPNQAEEVQNPVEEIPDQVEEITNEVGDISQAEEISDKVAIDTNPEVNNIPESLKDAEKVIEETVDSKKDETQTIQVAHVDQPMIQSDNYSVADVDSELPQPVVKEEKKAEEGKPEVAVGILVDIGDTVPEAKHCGTEEKEQKDV